MPALTYEQTPIGPWYQPASNFPWLKASGANFLLCATVDPNADFPTQQGQLAAWYVAAKAGSWRFFLQSLPIVFSLGTHNDANCLGIFLLPDEPQAGNATRIDDPANPVKCTPIAFKAAYDAVRAQTTKPICINLDGGAIRYQSVAFIQQWTNFLQPGDIVAVDYYPLNDGDGPGEIPTIGAICAKLKQALPAGVNMWGCIDPSYQQLNLANGKASCRAPTADELFAEIQQIKSNGGVGYICFYTVPGKGFISFGIPDAVPAGNLALLQNFSGVTTTAVAPAPPAPTPPAVTPTDPLAGATLTLATGAVYTIAPK